MAHDDERREWCIERSRQLRTIDGEAALTATFAPDERMRCPALKRKRVGEYGYRDGPCGASLGRLSDRSRGVVRVLGKRPLSPIPYPSFTEGCPSCPAQLEVFVTHFTDTPHGPH